MLKKILASENKRINEEKVKTEKLENINKMITRITGKDGYYTKEEYIINCSVGNYDMGNVDISVNASSQEGEILLKALEDIKKLMDS